jgi:hypothetical protein
MHCFHNSKKKIECQPSTRVPWYDTSTTDSARARAKTLATEEKAYFMPTETVGVLAFLLFFFFLSDVP